MKRTKAARNTTIHALEKLYQRQTKTQLQGSVRQKLKTFFQGYLPLSIYMCGRAYNVFLEEETFVVHY